MKLLGHILLSLSLFAAFSVRGQLAFDRFDPNANATIRAVVVQADGKILIGGDFTSLTPTNGGTAVARNYIARLNPDGTLDTDFNPNANATVYAIAVQADGRVLAGGVFTSIGGQPRNFLARLDATNGTADSFNPNPNSDVLCIAVQPDGKILVGGDFNQGNGTPTIGGATRNDIARLDATTGLADAFNPNAASTVYAIMVQADGKVLAGGDFNTISSQTRNHIARLDATTGLADSYAPNADGDVYALAIQADGRILAGGNFSGIGGQTRNYIARLDATTGLADSFNPNANGQINAIAVQADGRILAGGNFSGASSIGGQTRGRLARLDPITGLADSYDPEANLPVLAIAVQQDGKIVASGQFTTLAPDGAPSIARSHIVRLETDGRVDQSLGAGISQRPTNIVDSVAVQTDGKVLLGGQFQSIQQRGFGTIVRLNTDMSVDTTFQPDLGSFINAMALQTDGEILLGSFGMGRYSSTNGSNDGFNPHAFGYVYAIGIQADGKILVGGSFTNMGGLPRTNLARLDPITGAADTFNPNPNGDGFISSIVVQPDGRILVGGSFTNIGGQPRTNIARLDPTTGLPDSFAPNPSGHVTAIAIQADGKILAGGEFTKIGGQSRNTIARLDPMTGAADSFNPAPSSDGVLALTLQADGKILVGGQFTTMGGQSRRNMARLDPVTGLADSFNPDPDGDVFVIALRSDGKILAGGAFSAIGGATGYYFARLSNDTGAQQNLTATQNTITWSRGGSSPQFTRVTFETSSDYTNYTSLGNGTRSGSNWTLTGLNLPAATNQFIRGRGYYGDYNGSESIGESVRNVFLTPQLLLNIQLSAKTNVVLSWATNFSGFTLQSNANFNSNGWGTVSPSPSVSGANNVVTNPISGSTRYYRLRK